MVKVKDKKLKITKRHHLLALGVSLVLAAVCSVLIAFVNVNSDMTKYLPDDSKMKQGIDILAKNGFGGEGLQDAPVRAMFSNVPDDQVQVVREQLAGMPDVDGVSVRQTDDKEYTLYGIQTANSVDQKKMGRTIRSDFDYDIVVETSQDSATPPISVLVVAAVFITFVLFLTAQSWLDPIIALITIGVAVVLNVGSNALLPSVSITTNYIVPILQMVLSLDYSIVLLNRYRQELREDGTAVAAVNAAIKRAAPSILSSALTTIVGLLMLVFMRLKIGMDLGLVLAKGVLCCLVCTFTVLPALLIIFRKGIVRLDKKSVVLPTVGLARFATAHKIPLALFALVLFVTSFYFSRKTEISFSMLQESRIDAIFPKSNAFVVVYDTQDEEGIFALADSLVADEKVHTVISYPTLLKSRYTAEQLMVAMTRLSEDFADMMPTDMGDFSTMLTPEMLGIVYNMYAGEADSLGVTVRDMMQFVLDNCATNPLFEASLDDNMKAQIEMLRPLLAMPTGGAEPVEQAPHDLQIEMPVYEDPSLVVTPGAKDMAVVTPQGGDVTAQGAYENENVNENVNEDVVKAEPIEEVKAEPVIETVKKPVIETVKETVDERVAIIPFMCDLHKEVGAAETRHLIELVDTTKIRQPMKVDEMSRFIGSTRTQTQMVYTYNKAVVQMTPLEYAHFLCDDLFQRKNLSNMVSASQKKSMGNIMAIMDNANKNAKLAPKEIARMMEIYGLEGLDEETVREIAGLTPQGGDETPQSGYVNVNETPQGGYENASAEAIAQQKQDSAAPVVTTPQPAETLVAQAETSQPKAEVQPKPVVKKKIAVKKKKVVKKSPEELRAEHFMSLLSSTQTYRAPEMSENFRSLGQEMSPELVRLLYAYYGAVNDYDTTLVMTPEQLLNYVADTILTLEPIAAMIDESMSANLMNIRQQLADAVKQLSHDDYSLFVALADLPGESAETYAFVDKMDRIAAASLPHEYYMIGESVMYSEMKKGFDKEMLYVTIFTVLSIFLIVALTFRSLLVPCLLVVTVMTAVFVNVVVSGVVSGNMLYLAYLIVQSILMGATIDYGILFANYYKENRKRFTAYGAIRAAYRGSIRTIMTSGLIMIAGPGAMALCVDDKAISAIVGCLAVGAIVAVLLILTVLPATLVFFDKWVVRKKNTVEQIRLIKK